MDCYCCSGKSFDLCCQPFLSGRAKPSTAEALMRSRYSAYATLAIPYLVETTLPSMRQYHTAKDIRNWAKTCTWHKLEVISKHAGTALDLQGKVEFKAYYTEQANDIQIHHEYSDFQKQNETWYFVGGRIL